MIIVTGGGTGIGKAAAVSLHESGETVLATGRRTKPLSELERETSEKVRTRRCDHSDPADVAALAQAVDEPVTGLVLCAGGNPGAGRPEPATLDQVAQLLDETMASNVRTAALTVQALDPYLADHGSIVLFGSIGAERGAGFYGPAKAAVASLAVGLASRFGPRGITVNCVSPGYVEDTEFFQGTMTTERAEHLRGETLNGRTGQLADVTGLVEFLLSPRSRHLTGQTLHLDGGAHVTR